VKLGAKKKQLCENLANSRVKIETTIKATLKDYGNGNEL
jgi:hypothetical protein